MTTAMFIVVSVFDEPDRAAYTVYGYHLTGLIATGTTLRNISTGRPWTVVGEPQFLCPRMRESGLRPLLFGRTDAGPPEPETLLTDGPVI